jgi:HK97 family phage major capsid protein
MAFNNIISRADASGLMPEEAAQPLLYQVAEQSAAIRFFRSVPMSRAQQRIPVVSALPIAYFVNGDTGQKQTTEMDWTNVYINVEEIAAFVPIPENVLDDSGYPIWDQVRPAMAEAVGRTLDAAIFFWPSDIVTAATAAGNTATRTTTTQANGGLAGDLSNLFATIEADGYDVNGLVAKRTFRGFLRQVRATTGQRLPEIVNMVGMDEAYGAPINYPMRGLWPAGSGTVSAIAGDFSQGVLGVRKDITWDLFREGVIQDGTGTIVYNLMQQDMMALRITARYGWAVPNPINRDEPTAANRYPFAVMLEP